MQLTLNRNTLSVQREKGDPRARMSGYSRTGWSREHHFMLFVRRALAEQFGIELVKTRAGRDGHLLDDELPILRPAVPKGRTLPPPEHNIAVYQSDYMLRSAAEDYNAGRPVHLAIVRDYWHLPHPRSAA